MVGNSVAANVHNRKCSVFVYRTRCGSGRGAFVGSCQFDNISRQDVFVGASSSSITPLLVGDAPLTYNALCSGVRFVDGCYHCRSDNNFVEFRSRRSAK